MIVKYYKKFIHFSKQLFLNGFILLLPIAITFSLLKFCFTLVTSWLIPLRKLHIPFLEKIPHHELLLVVMFIFLTGIALKFFILRPLINFFETIFERIPLLRTIYFSTKQLIQALTAQDQMSFKHVVCVEFPHRGIYSIGFVTSQVIQELSPEKDIEFMNVYIPTTPNPTTGFFVMIPKDKIIKTKLTRQEAMALIISGGIIQPQEFKK